MLGTSKLETTKLQNLKPLNLKLLTTLSIGFLIGMSLEAIQYILPWRTFNVNDLMANGIGVVFGIVIWMIIRNRLIEGDNKLNIEN